MGRASKNGLSRLRVAHPLTLLVEGDPFHQPVVDWLRREERNGNDGQSWLIHLIVQGYFAYTKIAAGVDQNKVREIGRSCPPSDPFKRLQLYKHDPLHWMVENSLGSGLERRGRIVIYVLLGACELASIAGIQRVVDPTALIMAARVPSNRVAKSGQRVVKSNARRRSARPKPRGRQPVRKTSTKSAAELPNEVTRGSFGRDRYAASPGPVDAPAPQPVSSIGSGVDSAEKTSTIATQAKSRAFAAMSAGLVFVSDAPPATD